MDYATYHKAYFADPQSTPRFDFRGLHGVTPYFQDYDEAVAYYTQVLGQPGIANSRQAERLQSAFIEASGTGKPPSDQLMYAPVCYCPKATRTAGWKIPTRPIPGAGSKPRISSPSTF